MTEIRKSYHLTAFILIMLVVLTSIYAQVIFAKENETKQSFTEGFYKYEVTDGNVEIIQYIGNETNVVIPELLGGKPVVKIGNYYEYDESYYEEGGAVKRPGAFSNLEGIKTIEIPQSVITIGSCAFNNCKDLEKVVIGKGVTEIGDGAFGSCSNIKAIEVDSNNQAFADENGVLFNKSMTKLILFPKASEIDTYKVPENVVEMDAYAFSLCKNLKDIYLPKGVVSIPEGCFSECENLAKISISDDVIEIGARAFDNTFWLKNQKDGTVYLNNILYVYKGKVPDQTVVVIKDGTKSISGSAFANQYNLFTVLVPKSVEIIGENAFAYSPKMMVLGYAGTVSETSAKESGVHFVDITNPADGATALPKPPAVKLKFNRKTYSVKNGKTIKLSAVSSKSKIGKVTYKVINMKVAKIVKRNGNTVFVKGLKKGKTKLNATYDSKKVSCKIKVR